MLVFSKETLIMGWLAISVCLELHISYLKENQKAQLDQVTFGTKT